MVEKMTMREAYGKALAALGETHEDIVVLEADVGSSTRSVLFGGKYPERYFNVGIAEMNMVTMASGLALSGLIPFVNTFAIFLTTRGLDSINSLIAYDNLNVRLVGHYCGLSDSYDGASHQSAFDIACMRSLPNMTIISPSDQIETEKAVAACVAHQGPVYLRLNRNAAPVLHDEGYTFEIGKGNILMEGSDLSIVSTGYMVHKALNAARLLADKGIKARVVNIHTIKPLDEQLVLDCARETGAVLTVEEHSVFGGLGSAVAEVLGKGHPALMEIIGLEDYAESGDYESLLSGYGLDEHAIFRKALCLAGRKETKQSGIA